MMILIDKHGSGNMKCSQQSQAPALQQPSSNTTTTTTTITAAPFKSCLNWSLIDKTTFPNEFTHSNVEENFDLLFRDHVDITRLKDTFRTSHRDPQQAVRKFLWKRILINATTDLIDTATSAPSTNSVEQQYKLVAEGYNTKASVMFGRSLSLHAEMPNFVCKQHLVYYYLNDDGKWAVSRLLNVLAAAHPDITYAPLLLPLASLFLHYMNESDTYACLMALVESKNKITQTDIHWLTTNNVFRRYAQKYSHSAYDYLVQGLYKHTNDPEQCFQVLDDWQWWIFESLPFNYVLNIVDSFLVEGPKVLYRYGIALLEQFYRHSIDSHNHSSSLTTSCSPARRHFWAQDGGLLVSCMSEFCATIPVPFDKLLKTAFGYRNMSRKDIENAFQAEEKMIKKARAKSNAENRFNLENKVQQASGTSDYRRRLYSMIGPLLKNTLLQQHDLVDPHPTPSVAHTDTHNHQHHPQQQLQQHQQQQRPVSTWSNALKRLTSSSGASSKKWYLNASNQSQHSMLHYQHHHPQSGLNLPSFSLENTGSSILEAQQLGQLWRWLPTRYQILELQLVYSTNIHGCRLMTLMDKCEFYAATVIVVQTTNNAVFGAYCSQPWSKRISPDRFQRVRFFGNGESFLFELSPRVVKWEWVGKKNQGQTQANQELFQYADNDKIVLGGSGAGVTSASGGCFGLCINSDLTYGRTDMCDTFGNEILGTEKNFEIAILEIFSFNSS